MQGTKWRLGAPGPGRAAAVAQRYRYRSLSGGGHRGKKKTSDECYDEGTKRVVTRGWSGGGDCRRRGGGGEGGGGGERQWRSAIGMPSTMKPSGSRSKEKGRAVTAVKVDEEEGDGVRLEKTAAAAAATRARFLSIGNRGIHRPPSSISRLLTRHHPK